MSPIGWIKLEIRRFPYTHKSLRRRTVYTQAVFRAVGSESWSYALLEGLNSKRIPRSIHICNNIEATRPSDFISELLVFHVCQKPECMDVYSPGVQLAFLALPLGARVV